jgi:tetratricopeptide (TPR) repeat protein
LRCTAFGSGDETTGRTLQERLGELLDEVNELGLEQDRRTGDQGPLGPFLSASFNARRELLTLDAARIAQLLDDTDSTWWSRRSRRPSVSSSHHRFLGHALQRVGDAAGARKHFELAVAHAPDGSAFRVFALRGYAGFLYRAGEADDAAAAYADAVSRIDVSTDHGLRTAGQTYALWGRNAGALGLDPQPQFSKARELIQRISHIGMRTDELENVAAIEQGSPPDRDSRRPSDDEGAPN